MNVTDAVSSRGSIRAFVDALVPGRRPPGFE